MENIKGVFDFLEKKAGKEVPLTYKLVYAPERITKKELHYEGDITLRPKVDMVLPAGLDINGGLEILDGPGEVTFQGKVDILESVTLHNFQKCKFLPGTKLSVGYTLTLHSSRNEDIELPDNLSAGVLDMSEVSFLTAIPKNLSVGELIINANTVRSLFDMSESSIYELKLALRWKITDQGGEVGDIYCSTRTY